MHLTKLKRQSDSRQNEVAEISRSLKVLAGELNIPILALSQVNRNPELRRGPNQRPMLADLRESGALEQDADMVIFVHRDLQRRQQARDDAGASANVSIEVLPEEAEIIVAKQRNGATIHGFFGCHDLGFNQQISADLLIDQTLQRFDLLSR